MATHAEQSLAELLVELLELDFDAIAAYRTAEQRLEDVSFRGKMAEFRDDHERHTRELGDVVRGLGEQVPSGGDPDRLLTQGKVVLAGAGGDKRIVQAMKSNEDRTNAAYERALEHEDVDLRTRSLLQQALEDERRHHNWLEETLEYL